MASVARNGLHLQSGMTGAKVDNMPSNSAYIAVHPIVAATTPPVGVVPERANWMTTSSAACPSTRATQAHIQRHIDWLSKHEVHRMFQCLLFALAVDTPDDPREYLKDKVRELKLRGIRHWDMLIPVGRRPPMPTRPYWLSRGDPWDKDEPTDSMYFDAYTYNNRRLLMVGLRTWQSFIEVRRKQKVAILVKIVAATRARRKVVLSVIFSTWTSWASSQIKHREIAYETIQGQTRLRSLRPVLKAWKQHTENAKQARLWFERMSKEGHEDYQEWAQQDQFTRMLRYEHRVKIFSYLSVLDLCRCAQVCHSWQEVVDDQSLWESTDLSSVGSRIDDAGLSSIASRHRAILRNVNLLGCTKLGHASMVQLSDCPNIQDLNLSMCRGIRDVGLRDVFRRCPQVMYLNMSFTKLTDLTLKYLGMHAESLSFLSIASCMEMTDAGALALHNGTACRNIQWLDVSGCRNFSTQGLTYLIGTCGAVLHTLILNNMPTLSSAVLFCVGKYCGALQHISLTGCQNVSDKGVKALATCTMLQKFIITDNPRITGSGLKSLARACRSLSHVVVKRCASFSNEGLTTISQCNVHLLDISDSMNVTDHGIRVLTEGGVGIRRNLRRLNVSRCTALTGASFFFLSKRLTHITHLRLRNCESLTDLSEECAGELKYLVALDLAHCGKITDETLLVLGRRPRPTLRHVSLAHCGLITDGGMEGFVKHLEGLFTIDLSGCYQLTYDTMYHLTFKNRHLTYINLFACQLMDDRIIPILCGCCGVLTHLNLFGILNLTNEVLEKYLKRCKQLQTLVIMDGALVTLDEVVTLRRQLPHCNVIFDRNEPARGKFEKLQGGGIGDSQM